MKALVLETITNEISKQNLERIVNNDLFFHIDPQKSSKKFQEYYFKVTGNTQNFLQDPNFFGHFKYQYSLQGIDSNLLKRLESNKQKIILYIDLEKDFQLYNEFFSKVETKHGEKIIKKDFGSFFAKLAHTLKPDKYCALDNPIKDYFNLEKESFIVSFYIISQAYKDWCSNNPVIITLIKNSFQKIDKENVMNHDQLTDLKLLDLIFWHKANMKK